MVAPVLPNWPTPPMPLVRNALTHMEDVAKAVNRARECWNSEQLRDVLRSARHFIDLAEKELQRASP